MTATADTILMGILIVCAATDLLWGKVFNAVTFPAMAGGLLFQGWYAGAPAAFIGGMGILVALLFFFPLLVLAVLLFLALIYARIRHAGLSVSSRRDLARRG